LKAPPLSTTPQYHPLDRYKAAVTHPPGGSIRASPAAAAEKEGDSMATLDLEPTLPVERGGFIRISPPIAYSAGGLIGAPLADLATRYLLTGWFDGRLGK